MGAVEGRRTEYRLRVRWGDTDAFGIVFYPNFYAWMDQATHEFFRTATGSFADLFDQAGYALPIVETKCRFRTPARYDDELLVVSQVTGLRGRSFQIDHTISRDGAGIAAGYEVRTLARPHPDDPTRLETATLPDRLRAFLLGEADTPV